MKIKGLDEAELLDSLETCVALRISFTTLRKLQQRRLAKCTLRSIHEQMRFIAMPLYLKAA